MTDLTFTGFTGGTQPGEVAGLGVVMAQAGPQVLNVYRLLGLTGLVTAVLCLQRQHTDMLLSGYINIIS